MSETNSFDSGHKFDSNFYSEANTIFAPTLAIGITRFHFSLTLMGYMSGAKLRKDVIKRCLYS